MTTLSIDAMGGDHGLDATVPASIEVLRSHPDISLILVGDQAQLSSRVAHYGADIKNRLSIQPASQVVEMDENPAFALRKKKDSSMRVAINLVKDGIADACVSSGNTGALMATARFVLRTLPGIDRPAICAALPRSSGYTYVLDLGANVDTPPKILLQFGVMGSQLIDCLDGKKNPSVGLLNIGVEEIKGNNSIKATAELFKSSKLNYVGFVEADEIYLGDTDLIVCDGVLGNVALKASEGVAQMIMAVMKEEFSRSIMTRGSAVIAQPVLRAIKHRMDHRRYNGASLLGLQGTVVKSHGGADQVAFRHAIEVAVEEATKDLVNHIQDALTENISQNGSTE